MLDRRHAALVVVCVASAMPQVDRSIVAVALPSIAQALRISESALQWIVTAYVVAMAGCLLLGGRAGDIAGPRRVFLAGVGLFALTSVVCGAAPSGAVLVAGRALQGAGGAAVSAVSLVIVIGLFDEGGGRNRAVGVWGAVNAAAGSAGLLLGGVITTSLGWQWIFYINVPIGAAVLCLTPLLVRDVRGPAGRRIDVAGAVLITTIVALVTYTISRAPAVGWLGGWTVGQMCVAMALLAVFLLVEARVPDPLVPLGTFRMRTVMAASGVDLLVNAAAFPSLFLFSLYVQDVLGFSPVLTALTSLITSGTAVGAMVVSQRFIARFGAPAVLLFGLITTTAGLAWVTQVSAHTSFIAGLLGPYVILGAGIACSFIPLTILVFRGVAPEQSGLVSGVYNTAFQIGGALGVAVAVTASAARQSALAASGTPAAPAAAAGFSLAFWILTATTLAALGLAIATVGRRVVAPGAARSPVVAERPS